MTSENDFSDICFADLIEHTRDGEWGYENERENTTLSYVIRGTDFSDISLSNLESLPQRYIDNKKLGNKQLRPNDIIIETAGGTKDRLTGRTIFLKDAIFTKASLPFVCASFSRFLRVKKEFCDPRYLQYYLSNMYNKGQMSMFNVQHTGVSRFQYTDFAHRTTIHLPSILEQRAVSTILSALDDKIELNHRMNIALEAVGQALFERWFVDFEFPQEEGKSYKSNDGKMIDSELGEIPEGWTVGCLGDIANNVRNPVNPEDVKPETPYIGLEHMPRRSIALENWGHAEDVSSNKSSFHREDVLFGKLRPYFHKVTVAPIDGLCSTDILVIAAKEPEFFGTVLLHFASNELVKHADMTSSGTKMPRTSWSDLAQHRIVIPSKEIMRDFTRIIYPLVEKIIGNALQSKILVSMRDSLLPKLMSGKIIVPASQGVVET